LLLFPTVERLGGAVGAHNATARWQVTEPLSALALDRLLASLTVSGTDRGATTALSFLLLGLALWGAVALARQHPRRAYWLIGLWILPIATWLAILVAFGHWYNVRYTSAGLPAFLALVAVGGVDLWQRLWRWAPGRWKAGPGNLGRSRLIPDALLALGLIVLLAPLWQTARAEPREKPDWRGVARLLGELAEPGEPVISRGFWGATCVGHYLEKLEIPLEVHEVNYDPARARELTTRHPRAWVLSAGFREVPEFRAWTHDLDPVLRRPLGQIELFFFPGFRELLDNPRRVEKLTAVARELGEEPARRDFGASELLLGTGWSYPETAPDGMTFRWAQGAAAQIALSWSPPEGPEEKPRQLRLRLLPFPSPDRPPQTLEVAVQGAAGEVVADPITLEPGWQEVSIPLSSSIDSKAKNLALVTFRFGWSQSPRDLDPASADPRSLAVAFDFAEVVAP
ncbi:MAG: hypothetical protein SX243_18680, partial [Acidobacteriota bacterium]|nr:hypothetical protein [Acidobacteriota bacterium]